MLHAARQQRGIAALTALLIVTLATILAVELVWKLNLDLRRTEAVLTRDLAQQQALGVESLVIDLLRSDLGRQGNPVDSLEDWWAGDLPPRAIEGGMVEGSIVDLQGRFNLNKLLDANGQREDIAYQQLQRLLEILELDPGLADAVVDWIDPDDFAEITGAEDDTYTSKNPPYKTANFWFTSTTELMAVEGFDQESYEKLAPHLSALPPNSPTGSYVNVNTASPEVIEALDAGLSASIVESLLADRPFNDTTGFSGQVSPAVLALLDVTTEYFGLTVVVSIGSTRLTMYSLLRRDSQNVVPLLRSYDLPVPVKPVVDET